MRSSISSSRRRRARASRPRALAKLEAHRGAIDTLPGGPWEVATCGVPAALAAPALVESTTPAAIVAKD
jgi:hypothetical protein